MIRVFSCYKMIFHYSFREENAPGKGVCLQPPEGGPLVFLDPPMNGQVRIGKLVKYMYKILNIRRIKDAWC